MKTRVGNLFKRPLVMGDPNLVTGQEILVETNEDNQIVALKERKDNELSTIIASSSEGEGGGSEYYCYSPELNSFIDKYKALGLPEYTSFEEFQDSNVRLDETLFNQVVAELKPYCTITMDVVTTQDSEKLISIYSKNVIYQIVQCNYTYINHTDFYERVMINIQVVYTKDYSEVNPESVIYHMTHLSLYKDLQSNICTWACIRNLPVTGI